MVSAHVAATLRPALVEHARARGARADAEDVVHELLVGLQVGRRSPERLLRYAKAALTKQLADRRRRTLHADTLLVDLVREGLVMP